MTNNFINGCVDGRFSVEEIDNFIEKWNKEITNMELHEYLGFTEVEYDKWLVDSNSINSIISNRMK